MQKNRTNLKEDLPTLLQLAKNNIEEIKSCTENVHALIEILENNMENMDCFIKILPKLLKRIENLPNVKKILTKEQDNF